MPLLPVSLLQVFKVRRCICVAWKGLPRLPRRGAGCGGVSRVSEPGGHTAPQVRATAGHSHPDVPGQEPWLDHYAVIDGTRRVGRAGRALRFYSCSHSGKCTASESPIFSQVLRVQSFYFMDRGGEAGKHRSPGRKTCVPGDLGSTGGRCLHLPPGNGVKGSLGPAPTY